MSENKVPDIVGMHCHVEGGLSKCRVTMAAVCLSQYKTKQILPYELEGIAKKFRRISRYMSNQVSSERFTIDFTDLWKACSKVQVVDMTQVSGKQLTTYAIGEPLVSEDGFLYLSPVMREWWEHPNLEPIVKAIQEYLPDFEPWKLKTEKYFDILSSKSSLL
ncbi:hypothetical protein [Pectobacterium phage Wc4-1]|uniref:Uncharacterized protein n=1 Tax=Pectobacterium phage Wc4 TaxID=2652428 RepID=A0A5P8D4A8_9CAUD|nr:hypothetical protein [Pectobacterium phage Wc4]QFP94043.1 hypothetical protein [Pectobacterium phage Wc4-1]